MSRSFHKNLKHGGYNPASFWKRRAAKKVRHYKGVWSSPSLFKRLSESWDINDDYYFVPNATIRAWRATPDSHPFSSKNSEDSALEYEVVEFPWLHYAPDKDALEPRPEEIPPGFGFDAEGLCFFKEAGYIGEEGWNSYRPGSTARVYHDRYRIYRRTTEKEAYEHWERDTRGIRAREHELIRESRRYSSEMEERAARLSQESYEDLIDGFDFSYQSVTYDGFLANLRALEEDLCWEMKERSVPRYEP